MDFNFLLMAAENTAELTDKQIMGSTVIALLMFFWLSYMADNQVV